MQLLGEILQELGADSVEDSLSLQYTIVLGKGGYFQNIKAISSFSSVAVTLQGKKCELLVQGEGLFVKKYEGGDAVLGGNILSVERKV